MLPGHPYALSRGVCPGSSSTELGNLSLTKEVVQKIKVLIYKDMAKTNQLFGFQHFLLVR